MRWLRPFLRRGAVEREMDTELRFHVEQMVEEQVSKGVDRAEAQRRARLEFGGLGQVKDDAREGRIAGRIERFWREFRPAFRSLRRSPGFAISAVAVLALGIGANTLMYSLLDQILLRTLPVRDPQRLVVLHGNFVTPGMYRGNDRLISFSWPKYEAFRDHCEVFSGVAGRLSANGTVEYQGAVEKASIELVTGNYFDVIGVGAAAGRVLTPDDARTYMGHPVVVLGHAYWQRRFAGDPAIVGKQVSVNGMKMTVIGVSAAGYHSIDRGNDDDLRVPMAMKDLFTPSWKGLGQTRWAWLNIIARVRPGLSIRQAESGANVFYRQLNAEEAKAIPATYSRRNEFLNDRLDLRPAAAGMTDRTASQRTFFYQLMAIAGIVLLIACVNLAGLLIARTAARQREMAIRLALGAGRFGVVRQLLAENLLLAIAGGGLGVWLAATLARPASEFLISQDAGVLVDSPLDVRILLFALAVTILTAAFFALAPVLQIRGTQLADVLKAQTGAGGARGQVRLRKTMLAIQLAFCVWLMLAAGLFARSLAQLKSVNLGFRKERLITFQIDPMVSGYNGDQAKAAHRRLLSALEQTPGVEAASSSDYGVLTGGVNMEQINVEGYRPPPPDRYPQVRQLLILPGYMRSLGVRILGGRDLTAADLVLPPRAVLVNQAFAQEFGAGQPVVGRHIGWQSQGGTQLEIVGVVENQHYNGPSGQVFPFYYVPVEQNGRLSYYVRTARDPEAMLSTISRVVAAQEPGVPVEQLRTMEEFFNVTIGGSSRLAMLASFFGLLATLIAAIGLYGVIAYAVAQRTREIGLRMALGAVARDVMGMVVREAATVVAIGLAVGLPTGLAISHLLQANLFQISPMDPTSAAAAVGVVAVIGLLAALAPARRATRIDPMKALRWE